MARDRSIKLVIQAQVDGAKRALRETADEAKKVGKATDDAAKQSTAASQRMVRSARDNKQAWNTAGTALTTFGAAGALALGGSVKAAIDWESAWAGVTKTVDGTTEQLSALEGGLRGMARELPASHSEIAAVAEAAGQLGVKTEDIESFTRTMIDLGETTNLTADEAATAIAQMANIMGTAGDDIDNLGSALVALGNNGASTERDIIQMAQGMAGAAAVVGLAESDVLGFANAFASVGIEVEAGGSSFSRVITDMAKAAAQGGEDLDLFAEVAGMSAQEFARAFREDPAEAFATFIGGLGDMQAAGQDVFTVLDDLGLSDVRVSRALLSMATSGDLLTDSLALGAEAWEKNTALADEAAQRYDTVASKIQVAKNNVADAAISLGEVFMPAIAEVSEGIAGAAGALADLPDPAQRAAGLIGGVATGAALLGGALLLTVPRIVDTVDAFRNLNRDMPGVASKLGRVGRAAGIAAGAFVALQAAGIALDALEVGASNAERSAGELDNALRNLTGSGDLVDSLFGDLSGRIEWVDWDRPADALRYLADPSITEGIAETTAKILGMSQEGDAARERFEQVGQALAQMDADEASATFERLTEAFGGTEEVARMLLDLMPGYRDQLAQTATQMGLTADDATLLKIATGELKPKIDEAGGAADGAGGSFDEFGSEIADAAAEAEAAQEAYDGLKSSIETLGSVLLGARGSARDFEAAIDAVDARMGEDGFKRTLDITTEAGRKNQAVLDGVASSTVNYATAALEAGAGSEELAGIMSRGREEFIKAAEALGMTSDDAATLATNLGLVPDNVRMLFEAAGIDELIQEVDGVQDYTRSLEALIQLGVDPVVAEQYLETFVNTERETTVGVDADPTKAKNKQADLLRSIDTSEGTVDIDGNPAKADRERRGAVAEINASGGTLTIDGKNGLAIAAAQSAVWSINRMSAVINVTARYAGGLNMGGANRLYSSARAAGGVERQPGLAGPQYGRTNMILWGEPETRGEAFISNHPAYRAENLEYLRTAASWFGMDVVKAYAAGGVATAPSFAPAPSSSSSGPVTAVLDPSHAALLAAAVDQDIVLKVDSREVAYATRRGEQSFGAPGRWSGAPRMGRSRS